MNKLGLTLTHRPNKFVNCHMNRLRLIPTRIDKHAFEIKRGWINNLRLTPTMVVFIALALAFAFALIFSQWALALATDTSDMVLVPKGKFTMGNMDYSDEMPHQVVLDAYYIDKYEVSNGKYRNFLKATDYPAPAYWDDPRLTKPDYPVVGVNWYDATAYCEWTGKRLPTEAEWERAAKGPDGSLFPWGHTIDATKANYGQNVGKTMPVASYPDSVSNLGVHNLAGNVFEWVHDWYDPNYFLVSPVFNPQGPSEGYNFANQGPVKVLKGGSWLTPHTSLRTGYRFWNQPENNSWVGLGFRCALSADNNAHDYFIHALISMRKEQWNDALKSTDQAIQRDPENMEYQLTRNIIMKQIEM